ncbi:MAG: Crp/Fnr family transcriptional regulator [Anaerolineaceae bacterium]|jgi:CRP/FNR family transcriptional regulator|nr:MAG: Crp/Fnr family transcriptional regulator [Anaerolineaceae bacterium]
MSESIFFKIAGNSLSAEVKTFLETRLIRKKIAKSEQFLWEGDAVEKVFFIIRGYVKVFHFSGDGREQILAVLKSGQFVNTVSALRQEQGNHANGTALTDGELGMLDATDFLSAIRNFPDFALLLLHDYADKLDHLTQLVEELSLFSTRQRLIRFLLKNGEEGQTVRGWTQEEIAAQVGTVRDVISRLLGLFAREGLIRIERQRIIILDEERLQSELEDRDMRLKS